MKVLNFLDNVSCKVILIFIIFFYKGKRGAEQTSQCDVNLTNFTQGLSPSHLLHGHGNSRETPDTTLSMAHKTHTRTGTLRQTESLRGSLSNHDSDGNGNENGKTAIYRIYKQNNSTSASHFLFFFLSLFYLYFFCTTTT